MKKISYSLLLFLFLSANLYSVPKWERTKGPIIGSINCFVVTSKYFLAGGYKLTKLGPDSLHWDNYWSGSGLTESEIRTFAYDGNNLFAGTNGDGVFLSTNYGISWKFVNNGLTNRNIFSLHTFGDDLFAGTSKGEVFLSSDKGKNWSPVSIKQINKAVKCFQSAGTFLFAGTDGDGVFISTDKGKNWLAVNNGLTNLNISTLFLDGNNLYVGTNGNGVFVSDDNGKNWNPINDGITNLEINSIISVGSELITITKNGIFKSSNGGSSWIEINKGLINKNVKCIISNNSILYAAIADGSIYYSKDLGQNWSFYQTDYTYNLVLRLLTYKGNLLAGTSQCGIYLSSDNGESWNHVLLNDMGLHELLDFQILKDTLYAFFRNSFIFKSFDNGFTWTILNKDVSKNGFECFLATDSFYFAGSSSNIYKSTDKGNSWSKSNNGISSKTYFIKDIESNGKYLFAAFDDDKEIIYKSSDNGSNWYLSSDGIYEKSRVERFIVEDTIVFIKSYDGIYLSTNNGIWWDRIISGDVDGFYINKGIIYVGSGEIYPIYSSNFGETWNSTGEGLRSSNDFTINNGYLFGCDRGIYRLDLSTLDVDETKPPKENGLMIYPNPAGDKLNINLSSFNSQMVEVKILNQLGIPVIENRINVSSNSVQISTADLPSGMYYCLIRADGKTSTQKFVVVR